MLIELTRTVLRNVGRISPRAASRVAFFLFCRPTERKPVRSAERAFMEEAICSKVIVNGKSVAVYQWGAAEKNILLMHGWSSRASRFSRLGMALLEAGYGVIAFDAPGHGNSQGQGTTIIEYQKIAQDLSNSFGPFEAIVGHSFGVLCLFQALRARMPVKKAIAISGVCHFDYLESEFSRQLGLSCEVSSHLRSRIERLFTGHDDIWTRFSAHYEADCLPQRILVVHDRNDKVVNYAQAESILSAYGDRAELLPTNDLGHRRILNDEEVIERIVGFLEGNNQKNERVNDRQGLDDRMYLNSKASA